MIILKMKDYSEYDFKGILIMFKKEIIEKFSLPYKAE